MSKKPDFLWDEDTGHAVCIIYNGEKSYLGYANCHPEDVDMKSEKTGCEIAYRRAVIKSLRAKRDEIRVEIRCVKHLLSTMLQSRRCDPHGYEVKRIYAHLNSLERDLKIAKRLIENEQAELDSYLTEKGIFYQKIRRNREAKSN